MPDPLQSDDPDARADKTTCLVVVVVAASLAIAAAVSLALLPGAWRPAGPGALRHPAVGQKLPRLELQPLTGDGEPVSLDDLSGRVVLLNFWGTWCPQCLVELPDIAHIERTFRARDDFKLLAVSCGEELREDLEELHLQTATLLFTEHIEMPTYADPDGAARVAVNEVVSLEMFPVTLILDRGGVIRGVWIGPAGKDELEELITQLLEEE